MMITFEKSPDQLRKEDIERQALETAAKTIEKHGGNDAYQRAWKVAARVIRSLKPG